MEMEGKVALVTGANGFVGHYVVKRLFEEGLRVRALVRRPDARAELESMGAETVLGEMTEQRAREEAVRGAQVVVHCAASLSSDLHEARRVNVEATAALAEAARVAGCERFVHISTIAAYQLRNRGGRARRGRAAERRGRRLWGEQGRRGASAVRGGGSRRPLPRRSRCLRS
ncbi:NAD-dependent epimerase/dehydratase family protein [Sorangium sp. So ce296]|uniref:NAD-dependent epimerase/dehydratase family protein n=1 Tax=Sorangium sp. So ce296 TaxID=3133296 RepID=UPI003F60E26C